MKAISLWQPYASLIATGAKKIETRSWETKYRGPLAIHAAQKWTSDLALLLNCWEFQGGLAPLVGKPLDLTGETWAGIDMYNLPFGTVVAVCTLADCIPTEKLAIEQVYPEILFGDFAPGRFGWILTDVKPLPKPIPVKGKQGLWNWDGM